VVFYAKACHAATAVAQLHDPQSSPAGATVYREGAREFYG